VAAENLLRLSNLTSDDSYRQRAEKIFSAFSAELSQGMSAPRLLGALAVYFETPLQVILVTREMKLAAGSESAKMEELLQGLYLPQGSVFILSEARAQALSRQLSLFEGKSALSTEAIAYVCERGRCELPARNSATLKRQLSEHGALPISLPPGEGSW
jgi:uncharacterized protein YyaL (SSP411 family)